MGIYDTYGKTQLKIHQNMNSYSIGDKVDLDDGAYMGFEAVVVVVNGAFVAEFETMTDKWGNVYTPYEIIRKQHPIHNAAKSLLKQKERADEAE